MNELYRHFFNEMPCYVTVQNRDLLLLRANNRFIEDFGNFEERHCYQVYKQRSEKCEVCPVEQTFRDGQSHKSQETVRCVDGREVQVIVYTTPIRDDQGKITAVMEISTDITELKLVEDQLRESKRRYRTLFEQVPCYISIQDSNLHIVEANRRFRQDFGEALGCKCFEVYKHRNEECVPCAVKETFDDGEIHRSEEVVMSRDGQRKNVLVYTAPIHDAAGSLQSVMEMSTDITPIRELQTQLESIGLLISSVSHGIKGMLTGLDGGMYLVNSGMKKGDEGRLHRGWEMVERNIDRIRSMVLNILYYAKERTPNCEEVAVAPLLGEINNIVQSRADEHQVELKFPTDIDGLILEADPKAIRSLLINLIENSIDACRVDKKKDHHMVSVRAEETNGNICFFIEDNGIGMDRETCDKALSLFFSSKGAEGTGLGLFIANNIAQAHKGRIEIKSTLDVGTRFEIIIPKEHEEA